MLSKIKFYVTYDYFLEFVLSLFYLLTIFASKIPASDSTFHLKLSIFPILFTISLLLFIINNKNEIIILFSYKNLKALSLLLLLFILLHSLGLTYSINTEYGLQKFYGLLFNIIPIIIFTYFLIKTWNKRRTEAFLLSSSILICLSVIYILIISPFNYGNVRTISTNSWSHVYYGRFISLSFIVLSLIHFKNYNNPKKYILFTLLIFTTIGTFLSGLRAAEIGIVLFTIYIAIYYYKKKEIKLNKIFGLFAILIFSFTFVTYLSNNKLESRQNELVNLTHFELNKISSLDARIKGIEAGFTMFNEYPIIGVGLGGFNNSKYGDILSDIKYPHNIFFEYLFEYGTIGLIIFTIILFLLLKKIIRYSKVLSIIFLFTIWLALFSHDISSQKELYLFFVFYIIDEKEFKRFYVNLCAVK